MSFIIFVSIVASMSQKTPSPRFIRHFLLAIQFFTRIPITGHLAGWIGFSPAMLRSSAAHFPGVGVVVGGLVAILSMALFATLQKTTFTPLVVAVMGTVFSVMLTGAFHEDGLADLADGLGGSYQKERALDIMKDSRVGAFGALALVLVVFCKVSLLASIGSQSLVVHMDLGLALLFGHVLSRTLPLWLICVLPHVGDTNSSKSKPLADQISQKSLWVAFIWCTSCFMFCVCTSGFFTANIKQLSMHMLYGVLFALMAWVYMWRLLKKRLQGFTGDALGATQQVCEVAFYAGFSVVLF